jgi:hypothetical protein
MCCGERQSLYILQTVPEYCCAVASPKLPGERLKLDQTSSSSSVPTCHRKGVAKHKMARWPLQLRTPALPDFPPFTYFFV